MMNRFLHVNDQCSYSIIRLVLPVFLELQSLSFLHLPSMISLANHLHSHDFNYHIQCNAYQCYISSPDHSLITRPVYRPACLT